MDNIAALPEFQTTCERLGAKVTYFADHAVLANRDASATLGRLAQNDAAEVGFHIHPWNTPPLAEHSIVATRDSFLHNLPQPVAIQKLDAVFDAFSQLGICPTSYRGGRYSTSPWIQSHLQSRGVVADASVLPFTTWPDPGAPDFRERGLQPRRQTYDASKPGIWELPLTLAFTRKPFPFWRKVFEFGERSALRILRLNGIMERLWVKRIWLNLEHPLGESLVLLLHRLRTEQLPCVNITLHSSSLMPGLNPYIETEADRKRLYRRLESVCSLLRSWDEFVPATVSEVALALEEQHVACAGN